MGRQDPGPARCERRFGRQEGCFQLSIESTERQRYLEWPTIVLSVMELKRFLATSLFVAAVACGSAPAAPASRTVDLLEKDAGTTVQVRAGDTVRVQLVERFPVPGSSLVWDVTSSDAPVLTLLKAGRTPQVRSGPGGTDTYAAFFNAAAAGLATLNAHGTTTCEAMAKQSCPDRNFTIMVVVAG
jgi:predicted secreted protein